MWRYEIRTGHLYGPDGRLRGVGYSGKGAGRNNPDWCDVPNEGPIPPGRYSIGPAYHHEHLGPVTMNLDAKPGTETYGRSLFRMHGDNETHDASEGCPVQGRPQRDEVDASDDRDLLVV